jgi:para-aminobenzoate synthetase/4-amino-4-deoxychorismate lyase
MPEPSFIFDFGGVRRCFRNPVEIVRADVIDEVVPALQRVEAATTSGLWAAGYVSYEAAPAFERAMIVRPGAAMPLVFFGIFSHAEEMADKWSGHDTFPAWDTQTAPSAFHAAISQIHDAIAAGETYQVNYTNRLTAVVPRENTRALYERLHRAQGSGFHAYLDTGESTIVSASPELFFEKRNGMLMTRPMKGTRPRGRWAAEDAMHHAELAVSSKDRAENLMIVDLLRNDLGRVCETGTVRVPALFDIEQYRTVWQMTSRIEGVLRKGTTLVDIFRALYPCGSVTGAPKINTMKWIASLEDSTREVYCGAIGIAEPGGDCTFSVPIRTLWIDNHTGAATYGVGAGITADSDPIAELEELRAKSSILHTTFTPFSLFETMRCEQGLILRRSRHVERLVASAAYFGFSVDQSAIENELDQAAAGTPPSAKLRMVVGTDANAGSDRSAGAAANVRVEISAPPPARFQDRNSSRALSALEPVALAARPTNSLDPFLCHKTTNRAAYETLRVSGPYFDTLLWNERDEITEFTIGNVVLELDGAFVTPPRSAGLLAGVFRAELLDAGEIVEAPVRVADLDTCTRMWLINSLREWVEVSVPARLAPGGVVR